MGMLPTLLVAELGLEPDPTPNINPVLDPFYFNLVDPILNPSGLWRDFNGVYRNYLTLLDFEKSGLLKGVTIPEAPVPSDYPILG